MKQIMQGLAVVVVGVLTVFGASLVYGQIQYEFRIGAGARFQADALGPGWHRGFVNQLRTVPPCYILIIFQPRSSPEQPLRVEHTIPITSVKRLQITNAPGTSMQEWQGLAMAGVPENTWREVDLASLQPPEGHCRFEGLDREEHGSKTVPETKSMIPSLQCPLCTQERTSVISGADRLQTTLSGHSLESRELVLDGSIEGS